MEECTGIEEPIEGPPTQLDSFPDALLVEIAERVPCHVGLASLSGANSALRQLLCGNGHRSLLDQCVAALLSTRGWMPHDSEIAERTSRTLDASGEKEYYARRCSSLPPPLAVWPPDIRLSLLRPGGARTIRIGGEGAHFPTVRTALSDAMDGDTLCLAPGVFDEGVLRPSSSVRIVGAPTKQAPSVSWSGASSVLSLSTILRAQIIATAGAGTLCRLTLTLPSPRDGAMAPNPLAEDDDEVNGTESAGQDCRCVAVGETAAWTLEDCVVYGGVRCGGHAALAIVGCEILGVLSRSGAAANPLAPAGSTGAAVAAAMAALGTAFRQPTRSCTGLLVQGSARVLCRASQIREHARSGVTVQHAARLWLHDSLVAGNVLAGVKLFSRSPSLLAGSVFENNGHMGLLLRGKPEGVITMWSSTSRGNALGIACSGESALFATQSLVEDNRNDGIIVHNNARATLSHVLLRNNTERGLGVLQQATASLQGVIASGNNTARTLHHGLVTDIVVDTSAALELQGDDNQLGPGWPAMEGDDLDAADAANRAYALECNAGASGEAASRARASRHAVAALSSTTCWPPLLWESPALSTFAADFRTTMQGEEDWRVRSRTDGDAADA